MKNFSPKTDTKYGKDLQRVYKYKTYPRDGIITTNS